MSRARRPGRALWNGSPAWTGDWALKKADDLSKGMQQKVQFIATVLHEPELLVLDEPFSGLDPVNTQVMKDTVVDLSRKGTTILFSTHIMEQAEKLCDSVCIIARGSKVVDGPLAEIKRQHGGSHLVVAAERSAALDGVLSDTRLVSARTTTGTTPNSNWPPARRPSRYWKPSCGRASW